MGGRGSHIVRPRIKLLDDDLVERILAEARDLLATVGAEVHNEGVLELLGDHGAEVDRGRRRVLLPAMVVDAALGSAPRSFRLYDALGQPTHDFSPGQVY